MDAVKSWEEVTTSGQCYTPRTGHAAFIVDTRIYVFGGIDDSARQHDLHLLDLPTSRWSHLNPTGSLPSERSGMQATVLGDCVYLFGGYTKKHGEYFNDLYRFTPTEEAFAVVKVENSPPPQRTDHTLVAYSGAIYVFAGIAWRERLNDLWEFNPSTRLWRQLDGEVNPDPRFGHTASVYRDKMLIFGGWNGHETLSDLWSFSFTLCRWSRLTTSGFIAPRYRHTSIVCGSSLFVFGGVNKDQVRFADVFELNIGLRHWIRVETAGTAPSARTFHRTVLYEGFMYVFGGFDGARRNDMYRLYLQDLSPEEDIESNPLAPMKSQEVEEAFSWTQIIPQGTIFSKRTGHSAVALNGFLYVFAGTDEIRRNNDLYRYDISINAWAQIPALGEQPKARSGARGTAYNNALYFFGGYTKKDGEYFGDLHRFSISSIEWQRITASGGPTPRTDHSIVVFDASLYVFGGYDGKNKFNDVFAFDLVANEWRIVQATGMFPLPRFGHTGTVCGRSMYVFGGWDGHDTLDDLYELSFTSLKWKELMDVSGTKPSPRYRHTTVCHAASLYVFAGVDKKQTRFNDLYCFRVHKKEWEQVRVAGSIPTPRTFHRALVHENTMYVFGGFDGKRLNDLFAIKLPTTEKVKRQDSLVSRTGEMEEDPDQDEQDLLRYYKRQMNILKTHIEEMTLKLKKEEERDICRLCCERSIDTVLLECAHRVMCLRCSESLRVCPVCRKEITRVVRTY